MTAPNSFGGELHRLRLERGLTVRTLADRAGIAHSYVTDLERGNRGHRPSLQIIGRLAGALELPADAFHLYRLHVVTTQAPEMVDHAYYQLAELERRNGDGPGLELEA